jgi:translation initiation factor 1
MSNDRDGRGRGKPTDRNAPGQRWQDRLMGGGGSNSSSLVYSTQGGRRCRNCGQMTAACTCRFKAKDIEAKAAAPADGKVRVRREVQGRGGKTVTTITGVSGSEEQLKELAGELKKLCGSGGSLKDRVIEIQGDHCERLIIELASRGYRAIRAGG